MRALEKISDAVIKGYMESKVPFNPESICSKVELFLSHAQRREVEDVVAFIEWSKERGLTVGFVAGNVLHDMNGVIGHNINFVSVTAGYADIT